MRAQSIQGKNKNDTSTIFGRSSRHLAPATLVPKLARPRPPVPLSLTSPVLLLSLLPLVRLVLVLVPLVPLARLLLRLQLRLLQVLALALPLMLPLVAASPCPATAT